MVTEDKVREIIANTLMIDIDKVYPKAHLIDDLDADSLDTVELVMNCEEAFHIEIPDEVAERWHTVGDVIESLVK